MEQPEYSMLYRDHVEREYDPLYRKHGLGLTVFSPLMRGVLTGKYTNGIPEDSRANKSGADWFRDQIINGKPILERVARHALNSYFVRTYTGIDDLPRLGAPRPGRKLRGTVVICGGRFVRVVAYCSSCILH